VGYYSNGKITREEKDLDGDGQTDSTLYYDALERISRREEDKDHDGRPDVISHYEAGKLSRKELIRNTTPPEAASP
jgi:antitoxin component YwqK of YwqJK toxin-antitoxin module